MKKFHQNYLGRSNEAKKKDHKIKKHHSEEPCKCFAPFVKLHWHDCPLVNKPCPIHGNRFDCVKKEENPEPVENVTVSFYPSLKTERLFQPVKSLLAHCNPETKISFQYYSQKNLRNKENTRDRFIQTNSEDFKKASSNVFVEKTKSFINDKTNKMKKLKQCFYSPCNSIARKNLSQISVREKTNKISFDDSIDEVTCDSSFEWFSPRQSDFKNLLKMSDEKIDSDFITFTKNSKNSVINHKIFEIKHKKGLNDGSGVKFPKQPTQFVYSTYNINHSVKDPEPGGKSTKTFAKNITSEKAGNTNEKKKEDSLSSSGKSLFSSRSSACVTPFLLMPAGHEDRNNSKLMDRGTSPFTERIQAKDTALEKYPAISKATQTTFQRSKQMGFPLNEKPQLKSVSLQTEPLIKEKHSQTTKEIFLRDHEISVETLKDNCKDCDAVSDDLSDEIYWQRKFSEASREKNNTSNYSKAAELQSNNNHGCKELFATDLCDGNVNQALQTELRTSQEIFHKTFESEDDETQTTYPVDCTKGTQTSFSKDLNATDFPSSNVMDSDKIPKTWNAKPCLDTEFPEEKKCKCTKTDSMTSPPEVCLCKHLNLRETSNDSCIGHVKDSAKQSTFSRLILDNPQAFGSNNLTDMHKTDSETQKSVDRLSKAEQTSPKDEYFPQAFSDLSELKKIILKFFESANPKENDMSKIDKTKTDRDTMTDSTLVENKSVLNVTENPRKMNSAETQTTVHILMDDEVEKNHSKVKFRQSVLLSDENKSKIFFVCALCGREITRFCLNASTNTENHENYSNTTEKNTAVNTECRKIIGVKTFKKGKNVSSPNEFSKPKHIASPETEKPTKTLKSIEDSPRDVNLQKSCIPILITEPGLAYMRKDRNSSVAESRNVRPLAQERPEISKSTNSQIKQKPQSPRSPVLQSLPKQCMCNEMGGPPTTGTSKVTPISTPPIPPTPPMAQKCKIQPKTIIYSSLPRVEHSGVQKNKWRKEEQSSHSDPKPNYRKTEGLFYPVSVKSFWPIEVGTAWEPSDKSDNFVFSSSNQKRGYEKVLEPRDVPAGKKIKAFYDESGRECFVFGNPDLLERKREKDSVWIPSSSVPQISSQSGDFINQNKTTKSEEFVRISHQREVSAQVKRYDSDTSNELFTVESCHFKPVTLKYNQESFNNLFQCSLCKSLTFLKTNKEDTCYFWPDGTLSCHGRNSERNFSEKFLKEPIQHHDEEFLRVSLELSDTMSLSLEDFPDDNIPEEEEEEEEEEKVNNELCESYPRSNPQCSEPKSQSQVPSVSHPSLYPDVPLTSELVNTYRVNKKPKKYQFKKQTK